MVFPQCSYLSPLHWANVRLAGHYCLRIEDFNPANLCVLAERLHCRGNPLVVGDHVRPRYELDVLDAPLERLPVMDILDCWTHLRNDGWLIKRPGLAKDFRLFS